MKFPCEEYREYTGSFAVVCGSTYSILSYSQIVQHKKYMRYCMQFRIMRMYYILFCMMSRENMRSTHCIQYTETLYYNIHIIILLSQILYILP
jgi:GTP-dependent phosphoenolpyruvate carboxykinase